VRSAPMIDGEENRVSSLRLRSVGLAVAVLMLQGLACSRIQSAMIESNVDRAMEGNRPDWLEDDAMHVVLCGSGAPLLDTNRAGPCTAVIAGGMMFLVDVGPGSTERSLEYRLPLEKLDAVLLTHFHSDHIGELGEAMTQSWIAGRRTPLDVYGPPGVSDVVGGFLQAYSRDQVYRTTHHSEQFMPKAGAKMRAHKVAPEIGNDFTVLEKAGLKITAITVDHAPVAPAVGYRFDYAGRSVVISGDTVYSKNLERASKGVDLLVHEVLQKAIIGSVSQAMADRGIDRLAKLSGDILEYHTSPAEAVQLAREAGVRNLVFNHIVPPLPDRLARWLFFQDIGETGDTDVVLGHDGLHYRLAPGGETEHDDLD